MRHLFSKIIFLTATLLLSCGIVNAAAPMIIFERGESIWIAKLDGTGAKKIVDGSQPEISPDGSRVAYNTNDSQKGVIRHLAIFNLATGKVTKFDKIPSDNSYGPTWSPDSKQLLFNTFIGSDWQIALINADGDGYRVLTATEADKTVYAPAWTADGKSFFSQDIQSIYLMDLDGKVIKKWDIHAIIPNGDMSSASRLSASPDGKSLIMDVDMSGEKNRPDWDGSPPAIWLLDLASGKAKRLTKVGLFAWQPYWINTEDYLFISQGVKEKEPSLYRESINGKLNKPILKDARTPSVSRS